MILKVFFVFLIKYGDAACDLFKANPDGTAITTHDQLEYMINTCTDSEYGKAARTWMPVLDMVLEDGHGYYRSWTTVGALETIFKISEFTHDRLALVTAVLNQLYEVNGVDQLADGESFGYWSYITGILYTSVEVLYYDITFYNAIVDGGFAYEVIEFGNKNYQASPLFKIFNDIYSIAFDDGFKYPYPAVALEFSIYATMWTGITNIVDYVATDSTSLDPLRRSLWYFGNLLTSYTFDIMQGIWSEQEYLWNALLTKIDNAGSFNFNTLDSIAYLMYFGHDSLSIFHKIVRSAIRGNGMLLYQLFYGENLFLYNVMPVVSNIPGLKNIAEPIKDAGVAIMQRLQDFIDYLIDTLKPIDILVATLDIFNAMDRYTLVLSTWGYIFSLPFRTVFQPHEPCPIL